MVINNETAIQCLELVTAKYSGIDWTSILHPSHASVTITEEVETTDELKINED